MKRAWPMLLIVLGVIAFAVGLTKLFLLRFEAGDVYPAYSSLRSDPLGTMALGESLAEIPGRQVRQDFSDRNELPAEGNTTYLHLAADPDDWHWLAPELFAEIEKFVARGGRLAITMQPITERRQFYFAPIPVAGTNTAGTNAPTAKGRKPQKKTTPGKNLLEPQHQPGDISLEQRWGLAFDFVALEQGEDVAYQSATVTNASALPLPARLDWHSGLVLSTNLDATWQKIYLRGRHAVVVERKFGHGSVVFATDSYFLSNEAMWAARHPDLLAWFVGPAEHIVFDEAHLGTVEENGIAKLLRKYRLAGVVGALVLLAGLFIWQNAFSLVPPHADELAAEFISGKDTAGGFVNLLRRNIPPAKILDVCFEEWTKTLTHSGSFTISGVDRASSLMEAETARSGRSRDPVQAYRAISLALKNSKVKPPVATPDSEAKT